MAKGGGWKKQKSPALLGFFEGLGPDVSGRGERIRTSGLYVPNVALYQAKLHPDAKSEIIANLGKVLAVR